MPTHDFTDGEKAALIALLKQTIFGDPFPLSPRVQRLRGILAKLDPSPKPVDEPGAVLARIRGTRRMRCMRRLRLVLPFVLALAGCPGPDYAPYDNMTNSPG
jgi:hypothetical protein